MRIAPTRNLTGFANALVGDTICIFNGLIYDANFDRPLDLNMTNLSIVCVGGSCWVYDKMVRCASFTPTKRVKRFIFKSLGSKK